MNVKSQGLLQDTGDKGKYDSDCQSDPSWAVSSKDFLKGVFYLYEHNSPQER